MAIQSVLVTAAPATSGRISSIASSRDGYAVTVLDNLEPQVHRSGTWPSYANARRALRARRRPRSRGVRTARRSPSDAVVHFGAAVSVGQSMYQVDRYVDVNTRGTALLLDILVNAKHHVQKVLVASSIGVYGEGAYRVRRLRTGGAGHSAGRSSWRRATGSSTVRDAAARRRRCRRRKTRRCTATTSTR